MDKIRLLAMNSARSWGGNELWLSKTLNQLSSRGHEIHLAVRTNIFNGKLRPEISVHKFPFRNEIDIPTINKLTGLIKENSLNLVLATKRKEYGISGFLKMRTGLPVVFRLGIVREINILDLPQRAVYNQVPDSIIANARRIKDSLLDQNLSSTERIRVIYNGYDFPEDVDPEIPFSIPGDRYIFASAGRLTAQKGYDILIKACAKLKKRREDFFLAIAGEGGERKKYEMQIIENELEKNVLLPGEIDNVRGLFARSGCVLIPSRAEGIPNALFEAWSVKKSVIAAASSGIPEAVDHERNGILISHNPAELADAMLDAMENNEKFEKMGKNGFEKLNKFFSLENMTDKIETLFFDLIKK